MVNSGLSAAQIRVMLARFVAGRRLGDAAGPGWNGAGSVAGTLGAHGREGGFQLFGLLWGDGGQCAAAAAQNSASES
jgi:hypothetical protein